VKIIHSEALWRLLAPTLSLENRRVNKVAIILEPNQPVKVQVTISGDEQLLDLDLSRFIDPSHVEIIE